MGKRERSFNEEILDLIRLQWSHLYQWLLPTPTDALWLKVVKTMLKIPVMLFILLFSPVLLLIVIVIFIAAI